MQFDWILWWHSSVLMLILASIDTFLFYYCKLILSHRFWFSSNADILVLRIGICHHRSREKRKNSKNVVDCLGLGVCRGWAKNRSELHALWMMSAINLRLFIRSNPSERTTRFSVLFCSFCSFFEKAKLLCPILPPEWGRGNWMRKSL